MSNKMLIQLTFNEDVLEFVQENNLTSSMWVVIEIMSTLLNATRFNLEVMEECPGDKWVVVEATTRSSFWQERRSKVTSQYIDKVPDADRDLMALTYTFEEEDESEKP